MESVSLRPANLEDIPALVQIEQRICPAPWTEDHFRAELSKPYGRVLLLTDDQTDEVIHGYVVYWLLMGEAQILNIVVDLPFRGLGFAKRMIGQVRNDALRGGATKVMLDVRKGNLPAIQLYQNEGFAITSIRKGFYSDGEAAYTMTLDLDDSTPRF